VRPEGLPRCARRWPTTSGLRELVNEWVELAIELEKAERAAAKQGHEIDRNKLPEDPAALRQMVAGLLGGAGHQGAPLHSCSTWWQQLLRWAVTGEAPERVNENHAVPVCRGDHRPTGQESSSSRGE